MWFSTLLCKWLWIRKNIVIFLSTILEHLANSARKQRIFRGVKKTVLPVLRENTAFIECVANGGQSDQSHFCLIDVQKYTNSTQYTLMTLYRWWEQSDKLDASIFAPCTTNNITEIVLKHITLFQAWLSHRWKIYKILDLLDQNGMRLELKGIWHVQRTRNWVVTQMSW